MEFRLPTFILQPLVENSIKHGFSNKEDQCYISVGYSLDESCLHLLISDNGCDIPEELLKQITETMTEETEQPDTALENTSGYHSIGLFNVHQRLPSYYRQKYEMTIESPVGDGTILDIALPGQDESHEA